VQGARRCTTVRFPGTRPRFAYLLGRQHPGGDAPKSTYGERKSPRHTRPTLTGFRPPASKEKPRRIALRVGGVSYDSVRTGYEEERHTKMSVFCGGEGRRRLGFPSAELGRGPAIRIGAGEPPGMDQSVLVPGGDAYALLRTWYVCCRADTQSDSCAESTVVQ
jgi:hypothetical protein